MTNSLGLSESRSIATIVGTFFFLVIMIGGFAAMIAAFELNSQFLEEQFKISQQETQKVQEDFTIQAAYNTSDSNLLCVTIDNIGGNSLEIPDLFIVNKTASSRPVDFLNVTYKDSFIPMGSDKNILENLRITLEDADHTLDIKAVTTSGIMKTTELEVFASGSTDPRLNVTAFVFPKSIASGQDVVVGMIVHNTANTTLLEARPTIQTGETERIPTVDPTTAITKGFSLTTDSIVNRLDPNEDHTFMWDPEILGGVGSTINFTVQAEAKVLGCDGSSVIKSAPDSEVVTVVPGVRREIFAKPELLVTLPNPFGESTGTAYWAVAAANPTDQPVDVTQVSIQLIHATGAALLKGTTPIQLEPTADWTMGKNAVFWANSNTPITIQPFDSAQFIVRALPSVAAAESPINTVVYSIFSSFGQFNVVPFTFGYSKDPGAVVNVYQNTTFASGGLANFVISDIETNTTVKFNITLANLGATGTQIDEGGRMLINIPPGWTSITNSSVDPSGGMRAQTFLKFADGSTQIPVEILGSDMGVETRSYQFTAIAPAVSTTALYILTLTAEGTATGGIIIGPLSEGVLQVCPNDTGGIGTTDCTA